VTGDERIVRGLTAQMKARREKLDAGARPLGWKIAYNRPEPQEKLGLDGPVIGFMLTSGLVDGRFDLDGQGVLAEAEVAIHLGASVPADATREQALAAIAGLGPAIELVHIPERLDDIEAVLAGNVFHRAVALGEPVPGADLEGVRGHLLVNGVPGDELDAQAASGDLAALVLRVAALLTLVGEELRPDDRIIAGAIPPLINPEAGDRLELELGRLGRVGVELG
jgi:2-keto-4-pentenoate hydratase